MPSPSQTLSTTDSMWMSLSHPNGHSPIPNTSEGMMEEAAMTQFCSAERKFWRDKSSKFNWKAELGTGAEQKQQLILLQGFLLCWDFTQPQPFPNYTCRLCSSFTHCKRQKKEKKPLEWATVLCSIPNTAKKSLIEYLGQRL